MSSFSSVIRKPGAKVAPKVAPRRAIVRKPTNAQQNSSNDASGGEVVPDAGIRSSTSTTTTDEPIAILDDEAQPSNSPSHSSTPVTSNTDGPDLLEDNTPSQKLSRSTAIPQLSVGRQEQTAESLSVPVISNPQSSPSVAQTITPEADPNIDPAILSDATPNNLQATIARITARAQNCGRKKPTKPPTAQPARTTLVTPPLTQTSPSPARERRESVPASRAGSVTSQRSEAEEALNRINSQFLKIGNIASAIIRSTPVQEETESQNEEEPEENGRSRKRRKRNNAQPLSIEEQAAEVVANAMGAAKPGRRRCKQLTEEDREKYVIEAETTTLADLCKDTYRFGQTSEVEKQMAANWQEILSRRKEDAAERLAKSQEGRRKKDRLQLPDQPAGEGDMGAVPELVIENGQLVVASRDIDRHADTTTAANAVTEADIREDTDIYKRINSSTVGPQRSTIPKGQRWDDLSTEMFYQGLKMFGTDFKMISNMIPGKNRRQVKLKFNIEEKTNLSKVQRHLGQKETVELTDYASMTGLEFGSVADVYRQMEEDERKLREEDETRRREEGIISQDNPSGDANADVPVPSIETQDGEIIATDGQVVASDRQSTAAASRLGSTTTGRDTAQPPGSNNKKKPSTRKAQSTNKRGKQAANKTKGFEGVEERLGDVTEVSIPGS